MANSFSVAMCTYNGARFIEEQLESIAAQTRLPYEIVVCDDRSVDETVRTVKRFATNAPFPVRVYVNEQNLGLIGNFQRAIELCEGDLIALSDQDDVWLPEKLERLQTEFALSPKVGLVFSDADLIDQDSNPLGKTLWDALPLRSEERRRLAGGRAFRDLVTGSLVTGATMAFRARFRNLVLPIPQDLTLIHDGWLALVIAAVADISPVNEPLIKYRQHHEQKIGAQPRKQGQHGLSNGLKRTNPYVETLAIARSLRERLSEGSGAFDTGKALSDLDARIAHLESRADLPKSLLPRIGRVLEELLTLRYHHYSNGMLSAFKDLLGSDRQSKLKSENDYA